MKNKEVDKKNTEDLSLALQQTKQNIKHQAGLAVVSVVMTVILCFAMTVAWYSNILHTSDMVFKAENWDFQFEGTVRLNGKNEVLAAPGESGIVEFSVANVSDYTNLIGQSTNVTTIGVQVNVDKSAMSVMEPRIYFYVEKNEKINDETVERQYLTTQDSYKYTVYPGRTLKISNEYSNDYVLKWHWVEEVVGYYVRGELLADGTIKGAEYIRPIEYDSGKANYDSEGNLTLVNGVDVETFITDNYLKKDGIKGSTYTKKGKYYQLADNLFIYLCKQDEIKGQNDIDKKLSTLEDPQAYPARLLLTGVKGDGNRIEANSSADLIRYINEGYNIVEVNSAMTIEGDFNITDKANAVVDLNGNTVKVNTLIKAEEGSSISFINGTIITDKKDATFMETRNSEVYMDNVVLKDFECGIEVYDNDSVEDSHIYITQCEMTTNNSVIWVRGNGDKSIRKTSLVIEDSELISKEYIPVGGNGTSEIFGTDIQILSSTLKGKYAGIYHPMNASNLYIKNSTLEGITGLAIKGGHITIEDSHVIGNGTIDEIQQPAANLSGFSDVGSGIYIEDNYAVRNDDHIDLIIKGNKTLISSKNDIAIRVYEGVTSHVAISLYGGIYSHEPSLQYLAQDKIVVGLADGTFEVMDVPADLDTNVTE